MAGRKIKILLLDKSAIVQRQLQASLQLMRDCEIASFSDVTSALHSISVDQPDFILSSWEFEDYSALDLLGALSVREEWKQIPVLVSHEEQNDTVYTKSIEHGAVGVVFKPFDLKLLHKYLDSLFPPQDLLENTPIKDGKLSIRTEIKRVDKLAPMPQLVQSIFEICSDPNSSVKQLAEQVKFDQALTTKILRISNSAYYGFHREISNVDHALVVLGFEEVKNITLAACIIHAYPYESTQVFRREQFWIHSLCAAYTAKALRKYVPEIITQDAFVIGLLHDFGKVVLNQLFHNHFIRAVSEAREQNEPLHKTEVVHADINHADVGGLVGESWELPTFLTRSIQLHHRPEDAENQEYAVHLAHLANHFTHNRSVGDSGNPVADEPHPDSLKAFGFEAYDLEEVWNSLKVDVDAIRRMIV